MPLKSRYSPLLLETGQLARPSNALTFDLGVVDLVNS